MFKDLDPVALTEDVATHGLKSGDLGTIVHVYPDGQAFGQFILGDRLPAGLAGRGGVHC